MVVHADNALRLFYIFIGSLNKRESLKQVQLEEILIMKKIMVCLFAVLFVCACTIHGNVKNGNIKEIKTYVEKGGDINKKSDPFGHTPLYIATYYGYIDIAKYLVENNADVNAQAKDGTTPLMCSAIYNFPEITEILIAANADLNIKDKRGHTALFYAKEYRFFRVADYLEAAGAVLD